MGNKRLAINLISNIVSFIIQLAISFLITPIIVSKVGDAAFGFVGLANNFVSYATILTIIINSMASRFITVALVNKEYEKANKFYSSVFIVNVVLSAIILLSSIAFVANISSLLDVPDNLLFDVQLTFILSFINLALSLINTVFNVAAFAKNRVDQTAIRNIIGNIFRAILLIILFSLFNARIYYIIVASLLMSAYLIISNMRLSKKLVPELKISRNNFDLGSIIILSKSGIWNAINSLSKTLLTGLDLLISNIFIGADAMGILSIAKTIPNSIEGLLATFTNTFNPHFVLLYSQNKIKDLINEVNFSLKITAFIMLVPICEIIAFGPAFFKLWLPLKSDLEIQQLQILSILSLLPFIISSSNYTLTILDSVTNKLKRPVIATLIMSIMSSITTIVLLKCTDFGIYAVAGVSSIYWIVKVFFFNTINAAYNLNIKWNCFFNTFLKNLVLCFILTIIYLFISKYLIITSWISFICIGLLVGICGYIFMFLSLFNKEEKKKVLLKIKKRG